MYIEYHSCVYRTNVICETCIDMQYYAIYGIRDTFSKLEKVQFQEII